MAGTEPFSNYPLKNLKEAAAYIGVKPQTISAWKMRGTYSIPHVQRGARVFFRQEDLDEFNTRYYQTAKQIRPKRKPLVVVDDSNAFQSLLHNISALHKEYKNSEGEQQAQLADELTKLVDKLYAASIDELTDLSA